MILLPSLVNVSGEYLSLCDLTVITISLVVVLPTLSFAITFTVVVVASVGTSVVPFANFIVLAFSSYCNQFGKPCTSIGLSAKLLSVALTFISVNPSFL